MLDNKRMICSLCCFPIKKLSNFTKKIGVKGLYMYLITWANVKTTHYGVNWGGGYCLLVWTLLIGYVYNNVVFLGCYLRVHPHYRWESPPSSGCQWPQQTEAWRAAGSWTQTEHPPPDCMTFGWPLRRWGTPTGMVTPYPDTVWSGYQREAC